MEFKMDFHVCSLSLILNQADLEMLAIKLLRVVQLD